MKNFFASLFGSLAALIIFFGGCAFVGFVFLVAVAAVGQRRPMAVPQGSYLVFDLSANIQDAPPEFDGAIFGPLFGGERRTTLQLRTVTRAIRAAAKDGRIAGLLITGNLRPVNYGSGYGARWLLRLNHWDLHPVPWVEVYVGRRCKSVARGWTSGVALVALGLPLGTKVVALPAGGPGRSRPPGGYEW